jgi:outer membrane receptor protein involved in Fe transport
MKTGTRLPALILAGALLAVPAPGWPQIEELVVTARKREEALKDVPIAVEAFTAEELERKGIADIADLAQQSASIKFDQGANRSDTRLSIRGISPTRGRQNAAINVDGIDISSESLQTSGGSILINQRLMSLERIEVVKGPQIALWGRSAFNGAVNFVTKDPPQDFGGEFVADGNGEDQYSLKGEVGGPLFGEKLSVLLTGGWWDEQGLYANATTGEDIGGEQGYGFALKLRTEPVEGFTIRARAALEHYEFEPTAEAYIGYNRLVRVPQSALTVNNDPRLPAPAAPLFCLQRLLVNDPNFPYADSASLPQIADLDPDPANPNEVVDRLFNQTLIDRYARQGLDQAHPVIPDSAHCQEVIPVYAGTVPDGDRLQTRLATNPFTGRDYEGIDGDTLRLSLSAEWQVGKGVFSSWTGYTHDDNAEQQDNGKFQDYDAIANVIVPNVNFWQSDVEKFTRQFQQELRYATQFDGPVNVTLGGNYWEEDVDTDTRNLSWQSSGSYCFYSSGSPGDADVLGPGFFGGAPPCPGYTQLPIVPFIIDGFDWGDPAAGAYPGIHSDDSPCRDLSDPAANGDCIRTSPVDRQTDHRSFYSMVEIETSETTKLTFEGRYSHEELTVSGARFLNPFATGGPQSWSICGAPGRPCDMAFLAHAPGTYGATDLGGPYWNPERFQQVYDVWRPYAPVTLPASPGASPVVVPQIDLIPAECRSDPAVQARIAQSEANLASGNPTDGIFDLTNPFCIGRLDRTDDWFSPKITLDWKPNPKSLVYLYWARAEKPGGFTLFTVGTSGLRRDLAEFEPEKLDTWEIGGNTTLRDNTLFVSGAVFYNDYTDKQVLINDIGIDGRSISKIANAPAELWGAELSAVWQPITPVLGGEWSLSGSYTYIDSQYLDFIDPAAVSETNIGLNELVTGRGCEPTVKDTEIDTGLGTVHLVRPACSINWHGNQFERSPEHAFVGTIGYTRWLSDELSVYGELSGQWKDEQPIEFDNVSWLDAYWNLDLRLGLRSSRWEVIGYVTNLLDDDTIRSASNQPGLTCCFNLGVSTDLRPGGFGSIGSTAEVPSTRAAFLPPPRIVGLRATYRFGGLER